MVFESWETKIGMVLDRNVKKNSILDFFARQSRSKLLGNKRNLRLKAISYGRFLETEKVRFRAADPINRYRAENGNFPAIFFRIYFSRRTPAGN